MAFLNIRKAALLTLLLATSALPLTACDDSSEDTPASTEQTGVAPSSGSLSDLITPQALKDMRVRKTLSGDYLVGFHAQVSNDWEEASSRFEDVLTEDQENTDLEVRVMALSLGAGDYTRALALAHKIADGKAENDSLASLLIALENFKAEKYAETHSMLESVPHDSLASAIIPLIRAWTIAADPQQAGTGGEKTSPADILSDTPSFLYQAVFIADYMKDKEAVRKLATAYDFNKTPSPISRMEQIADIFARYGETEKARTIYTALKGAMQGETESLDKKIASLATTKEKATTEHAEKMTAQEGLAEALLDTARLLAGGYGDSAILFTHMSRILEPNEPDALELLAQFAADNRQYKSAIGYLSKIKADEKHPEDRLRRQMALLLEMDGQKNEAVRVLSELVGSAKNVEAQIQIGDIYREDEDYKSALDAYNKAAEMLGGTIPQEHWQLLFSRGMVYERLSDWDNAEKDLKAALAYEPDQPYILNYLGYSWADKGDNLDKAAKMIERAVQLKPDDGAIVDSLGWVYYREGKFADAVRTLETAVELQPYESEINDHLGDAYWRVGRKNEARFQWKRALSFTKDETVIKRISEKVENGLPDLRSAESAESEPPQPAPALVDNGQKSGTVK